MAAVFTIVILFLLGLSGGVSAETCTAEKISNCTAPLKKYEVTDESSIVPNYPIETMKEICRTYETVKACLRVFEHKCHIVDRKWFEGVHDSYQYLCDDHFAEYERHRDCLATPELHKEGQACNWTLQYSFSSDTYQQGDRTYKAQRICQYAKTYLNCVENLVHSFCGEEAASWQRGFDESSLRPLLSAIGCNLGSDSGLSDKTVIIIGITITMILVLVFIFCGIAMWLYSRKKHARDARRSASASTNGAAGGSGGNAVYRISEPGAEGNVAVMPYAYSTPSPIPPPYAEKPPAYGTPQENGYAAAANGLQPFPTGYNTAAASTPGDPEVKLPLPPDYDPNPPPPPPMTGGAQGPTDSDYLELHPTEVPSEEESGYAAIGDGFPAVAPSPASGSTVRAPMPLPQNTGEER